MKLSIASSAILLRTFVVGEEATITKTALSSLSSNNKHDQDLTKRRQRRFLDNNNNQRLLLRKQQDQHHPTIPSSTISPRLRSSASADFDSNNNRKRNGKSGALQNTTSVIQHHSLRQGDESSVRECLPRQTTETVMDSVADVGILGCGMGEYCMESLDATTLGGKCINVKIEDDDVSSHSRQPSQLSRIQRPLLAFIQNRHAGEECDPSLAPSLTPCGPHQHCVQNDASSNGGSCVPLSYDSSNKVWSRLRNLQQSTYSYSTFFDFIQYSCYYDTDPLVCECTTDPASGATAINCENTPPCENRTSPCAGDYSELQYCNQMTIQAQGTSVNDFDFKLCYGYLSPVDMIYCYQIVSKENLLTCNMLMNDEQCTSCELDADDICIEFDCRNTPSGRKGNLCEHNAMGNPAFLDLLDCSGACNICGEGNKLENYDFNLQPILSNTLDCYSPLFCDDDLWTCQQLQEVALVGVPIGGDSCKVAPSVDLFPLCCVEAPPDVPPPPEDKPGTVPCEALDHDCFSCLENEDCFWCPGDAICSSSPVFVDTINVFDRESSCNSPEDFVTETCTEAGNFFSDPLYSAQKWIFDMIKVQEVWAKGYTGNGIHVRVNDEGIESSHPEFENRIDKDASCPSEVEPIPSAYENGFSHGTAVASILGGAAGNDVCGVGIAPNVTMSSCHFNSNKDFTDLFVYKLTTFDISQNSWGRDSCVDLDGRRLQGPQCPFTFEQSHAFPCEVCDFSNLLLGTFSCVSAASCQHELRSPICSLPYSVSNPIKGSCIDAIESHCRYYFREDRLGCLEHLDLTLGGNCDFQSLTDENRDAFARGVTEGRDGKGVIFVFASGNSLHIGANTNFEGFGTNTRMAMAVGAVGKDGIVTTYSTEGSSLFVSAPGGDITNSVSNMVSASINGGCTDSGQGTSFAAPIVSGVVAMMLEANNELTYRDVQAIIASTSQPVEDELDNTAGINGAGRYHSNFYGFGIINAIAAVEAAENWELVGNETMVQAQSDTLNKLIPDDETKTIEETLEVTSLNPFTIESVYLYLKLEHSSRGHLQIKLTSPSGTESILTPGSRPENTQQADSQWWKLLSWKFWGEIPDGEWKISIADLKEGDATFEGSCADFEWSFLDRVTCDVLERGKRMSTARNRASDLLIASDRFCWKLQCNIAKVVKSIRTTLLRSMVKEP
jgi:subtilisin-like proprotein convertase family protein